MVIDLPASKPWGFGLFSRIVYVHQAFSFAVVLAALRRYPAGGVDELIVPHLFGIVLALAVLGAMFGVASRHSLQALSWLRAILWIGVINLLVVHLWLLVQGQTAMAATIRAILLNELISIPMAIYWSRPVHQAYLASFKRS